MYAANPAIDPAGFNPIGAAGQQAPTEFCQRVATVRLLKRRRGSFAQHPHFRQAAKITEERAGLCFPMRTENLIKGVVPRSDRQQDASLSD